MSILHLTSCYDNKFVFIILYLFIEIVDFGMTICCNTLCQWWVVDVSDVEDISEIFQHWFFFIRRIQLLLGLITLTVSEYKFKFPETFKFEVHTAWSPKKQCHFVSRVCFPFDLGSSCSHLYCFLVSISRLKEAALSVLYVIMLSLAVSVAVVKYGYDIVLMSQVRKMILGVFAY